MEKMKIIQEKLNKIKIELIHEPYHDGWYVLALKSLKEKLELQLLEINNA